MPFKKVGANDYVTPRGNHFNGAQVRLWYAHGGKFPGQKGAGEMAYSKGHGPKPASYAKGGAVLGRQRAFLKEPDEFSDGRKPPTPKNDVPQVYGKGKGQANPAPHNKQVPVRVPRS